MGTLLYSSVSINSLIVNRFYNNPILFSDAVVMIKDAHYMHLS